MENDEPLQAFLAQMADSGPHRLEVAITYSKSMVLELDKTLNLWKAMAQALQRLQNTASDN